MKILKTYIHLFLIGIYILLAFQSCRTMPITGRKQLNLVPDALMLSMSFQQYDEFLRTNKLSKDKNMDAIVKRVGRKIQKGVEEYFSLKNRSYELNDYKWEFNLVENQQVNAWCMPGGKVVVYTGILKVTDDEDTLAVVIAHEIAHAVAKHGNERMSHGLLAQMGGIALSNALKEKPAATKKLWMSVFGLGAQFGVILPYSRLQESEADYLGLLFMAMAGYNPHKAVEFWEKMAQMKDGRSPPEFASTHPSDAKRIENIKEKLPDVMKYYKKR